MVNIVLTVIGLLILGAVIVPFLRKNQPFDSSYEEEEGGQDKERLFLQLSDLEYDYQMKKISQEDYESIKTELTARAAHWLDRDVSVEQVEHDVDKEIGQYLEKLSGKEVAHEK